MDAPSSTYVRTVWSVALVLGALAALWSVQFLRAAVKNATAGRLRGGLVVLVAGLVTSGLLSALTVVVTKALQLASFSATPTTLTCQAEAFLLTFGLTLQSVLAGATGVFMLNNVSKITRIKLFEFKPARALVLCIVLAAVSLVWVGVLFTYAAPVAVFDPVSSSMTQGAVCFVNLVEMSPVATLFLPLFGTMLEAVFYRRMYRFTEQLYRDDLDSSKDHEDKNAVKEINLTLIYHADSKKEDKSGTSPL